MTASFPNSVKTFTAQVDGVSTMDAADVNDAYTEIEALETLLQPAAANLVVASPASGPAGATTMRALVDADIPAAIARDSEVTSAIGDHNSLATAHSLTVGISQALTAMRTPSTSRPALTTAAAAGFDVVPYTSGTPFTHGQYGDVIIHHFENGAYLSQGETSYSVRTKINRGTGNSGTGLATWEIAGFYNVCIIGDNTTDPFFTITDRDDAADLTMIVNKTTDGTKFGGGVSAGEVRYFGGNGDSGGLPPPYNMFLSFGVMTSGGKYSHFSFLPTTVDNRGLFGINTRAPLYPLHVVAPAGQNNEIMFEATSAGVTNALYFKKASDSSIIGIARNWDDDANLTIATGSKAWKFISASGNFYASGGLGVGNLAANTNTPSGVTAYAMPIYDSAGTLKGYIPVYAAAW